MDPVDEVELEALVQAAAAGDEAAWQRLWTVIDPLLAKIIGHASFLGRLGTQIDDRRAIVIKVMARLRADNFHRLGLYLDARRANPQLKFQTWLRVVAKRVGIDHLRAHPDYVRRHDDGASKPGEWVAPETLPPASQLGGKRPPMTNRGTAHELLDYIATLPDGQKRAIHLWLASESFDDIAKALALGSGHAAEKLVRAGLEKARRKFREATENGT